MPANIVSRLADTVGDGSGNKSGVGDFSSTSRILSITAQPNQQLHIERMIMGMQAGTIADPSLYGSTTTLANGITVYVNDSLGNVKYNLTDPDNPITANGEWAHYCYDYAVYSADLPTGDDIAAARWTFAKSGTPVILLPGWSINVLLQDNLSTATTGLTQHHFLFQGYEMTYRTPTDVGHA